MDEFLHALEQHAAGLSAMALGIAGVTGFVTFLAKTRYDSFKLRQEKEQGRSGLVADALALQDAAQAAYEQAQESADKANAEAKMTRAEFAKLRKEIEEMRDEIRHWRCVAEAGREAAVAAGDPNPFWFQLYEEATEA